MSLRETASGLLKVLSLITEIFNVVRARGLMLHEAEIACIMPHLIDKSGKKASGCPSFCVLDSEVSSIIEQR